MFFRKLGREEPTRPSGCNSTNLDFPPAPITGSDCSNSVLKNCKNFLQKLYEKFAQLVERPFGFLPRPLSMPPGGSDPDSHPAFVHEHPTVRKPPIDHPLPPGSSHENPT
jgi:hypothetical protein